MVGKKAVTVVVAVMAACTPIVYLGGREEMKSQCELCKFCTVFHYWDTNQTFS